MATDRVIEYIQAHWGKLIQGDRIIFYEWGHRDSGGVLIGVSRQSMLISDFANQIRRDIEDDLGKPTPGDKLASILADAVALKIYRRFNDASLVALESNYTP